MKNYVDGKVIVITGAAGGFGRLVSQKTAAMGAKVVCADINEEGLKETVASVKGAGGIAEYIVTDVTKKEQMDAMAAFAVEKFGRIDVLVNNAGIMPLAFLAQHKEAWKAWDRCIDINIKGVLFGIMAVYDQMMEQGQGHVINLSSIYGNAPYVGSSVYSSTKIAVRYLTEILRQEAVGKIKTTIIRPTGTGGTNLASEVHDMAALGGILSDYGKGKIASMSLEEIAAAATKEDIGYLNLDADSLSDQIVYAINQPWGVSIADITVRASGEIYQ